MSVQPDEYLLKDAPIKHGNISQWQNQNRTLMAQLDGVTTDGVAWITAKNIIKSRNENQEAERPVEELKIYSLEIPDSKFAAIKKDVLVEAHSIMIEFYDRISQILFEEKYLHKKLCFEYMDVMDQLIQSAADYDESDTMLQLGIITNLIKITLFKSETRSFALNFIEWIRKFDSERISSKEIEVAIAGRQVYKKDSFWDMMYRLATSGMNIVCEDCLNFAFEQFDENDEDFLTCLKHLKQLLVSHERALESIDTFVQWRQAAINGAEEIRLTLKDGYLKDRILTLSRILHGDIRSLSHATSNWYQLIGAQLLYIDPSMESARKFCDVALEHWELENPEIWEVVLYHLLHRELLKMLQLMQVVDLSFASIVAELININGDFKETYGDVDIDYNGVIQWSFVSHCQECLAQNEISLLITTVDFLEAKFQFLYNMITQYSTSSDTPYDIYKARDFCTSILEMIGEYIPHVPLESKEVLEWAVAKSESFVNRKTSLQMFGIYALSAASKGRYYEALSVLDIPGDIKRMRVLCWSMFERVLVANQMIDDEDTLLMVQSAPEGFSPELRECVSPFAVLMNYNIAIKTKQFQLAADMGFTLVSFHHMKREYILLLIAMMIPLMEPEAHVYYSSQRIFHLLSCIDYWQHRADEDIVKKGDALLEAALHKGSEGDKEIDWRTRFDKNAGSHDIFSRARQLLAQQQISGRLRKV